MVVLKSTRNFCRDSSGFTLIEIMIVVVIVGVLASLILPQVSGKTQRAFRAKTVADIQALSSAVELYNLDHHRYPSPAQGLRALLKRDASFSDRQTTSYIRKLPRDPWDNAYNYTTPGQYGDYDIWSYGADGKPGGDGDAADIGSWIDSNAWQ